MKNEDPNYILMSRKEFDRLMVKADQAFPLDEVRKLNPSLDAELAAQEDAEKQRQAKNAQAAQKFVDKYYNETVWYIDSIGLGPEKGWKGCLLRPCKVMGLASGWEKEKGMVCCAFTTRGGGYLDHMPDIPIARLIGKDQLPNAVPDTRMYGGQDSGPRYYTVN